MYVSMSIRLKVDVEAFNMVEPSGSYIKHRTIPLIVESSEGRYRIVYAPAASGQSIAYAYQKAIVELAKQQSLPLCNACSNYHVIGGFVKQNGKIDECVIEDLTGFMITDGDGIDKSSQSGSKQINRRTSPVSFSYLIPDPYSIAMQVVPQMHVRFNQVKTSQQQIFEIEVASAIYTLSIGIDIDKIGVQEKGKYDENKKEYLSEKIESKVGKEKLTNLAFDALIVVINGELFGAKKSRIKPSVEFLGAIAAIADPLPFEVSVARVKSHQEHYINDTYKRAIDFLNNIEHEMIDIYYFTKENLQIPQESKTNNSKNSKVKVNKCDSVTDMISKIKMELRNRNKKPQNK